LPVLIRKLVNIPGVKDIAAYHQTAFLLAKHAEACTTRDPQAQYHWTLWTASAFFASLAAMNRQSVGRHAVAQRLGFGPMKINAVAVKEFTGTGPGSSGSLGRENGIEIRFIGSMPLDAQGIWLATVSDRDEMIATLSQEISPLVEIPDGDRARCH